MSGMLKLILVALISSASVAYASELSTVVATKYGSIQGVLSTDNSVEMYKGLAYAKAPIGELRWQAPQPVAAWRGVKVAADFQAGCFQGKAQERLPWSSEFLHVDPVSEDCLYLNIWSPADKKLNKKPVIVFIHGGGFMEGSGSVPIYDGVNLAKKGVVYITLNYRLGVFGFLSSKALTSESGTSGNYGLQDQIAALQWVKENISTFGGDENNITIMGQSAGANSVLFLNASPLTQGLFNKSVIESATPTFMNGNGLTGSLLLTSPLTSTTLDEKINRTEQFLSQSGLSIKQLKNMDSTEVFKAIDPSQVSLVPAIDGQVIEKSLFETFSTTHRQNTSIILGFNKDELSGFFGEYRDGSMDAFKSYVRQSYPTNADVILNLYPGNSRKQLNRDQGIVATQNLAKLLQNFTQNKVYSYFFTQDLGWQKQRGYGTFHTSEVPFILDNLSMVKGPVTETEHKVAKLFSEHLVKFSFVGNPSLDGHVWTDSSSRDKWLYVVSENAQMQASMTKEKVATLEQLGKQ